MNRILFGGALGAIAMYFLDPQQGRRRRARTRDRLGHVAKVANEAGKVTARDAVHRAQGLVAGTRRLFDAQAVPDETLGQRVRSALGRAVSHPHAIEIFVDRGHVDVSGPILADEVRPLLKCVRLVPGVRGVSDQLTVYSEAGHVSALQGGVPRHGARFELLQDNWSPAARLLTGALGAGLMLQSLAERGSHHRLRGAALAAAGAGLLARSVANRDLLSLFGLGGPAITVQKVIHVNAPIDEVFGFWADYQNFPRFMSKVKDIQQVAEGRSRWVVSGPAGVPVHWTAEVTRIVPRSLIAWRATADSFVRHKGSVHFDPASNGATRVMVELRYSPPAGAFGHAVAALFGADPKSEMDADLMRMKTMIETGRAPHDAARPLSRES
jgi:uncharacterized membrane protein